MRMSRLFLLALAVVLLAPAATAHAQFVPLDHFLFYSHAPIPANAGVQLYGQFDSGYINTAVGDQIFHANPVEKTHAGGVFPINDPWRHLTWYRITSQAIAPVRQVRYHNQFGEGSLKIQNAVALLVPAEKLSHPGGSEPPQNADHYKCYRVVSLDTVPPTPIVSLKDQFQFRGNVGVFSPRFFCVPVRKVHNGVVHGIHNFEEHLVIYDLSTWEFPWQVTDPDQFLTTSFVTAKVTYLGVPTFKLSWQVVQAAGD